MEVAVGAMLCSCISCTLHISEGIIYIYVNRPRIMQHDISIAVHSSPSNRATKRAFQAETTACVKFRSKQEKGEALSN